MNDYESCEFKPLNAMKSFKCYEQLRVVDDMNDFESLAQVSECCEQLKVIIDVNNSRS